MKGNESYHSVVKKLQTSHRLISLWVESYKVHGKSDLPFKNDLSYNEEFKLRLLQEMLNEGVSLHQLLIKHLFSPTVISSWKRQYKQGGVSALFIEKRRGRPSIMKKIPENKLASPIIEKDQLHRENEQLRAENDYQKKKQALIQKQKTKK